MKKLNFKPRGIIFDMDGVIVDSMPYHFIAWYEALRPYGVRISCLDVYSKEGEKWDKSLKDFLKRSGIEPKRALLRKIFLERKKIFNRYFKRTLFFGVEEFLSCLKDKRYNLGLVTGTPAAELKKILPLPVAKMFDAVVAGDCVKKGKPHPDPYLKAARMLKLKPKECIVVENAPFGIESARRAGMFCLALTTSLPKAYLKKADIVVERLEDITGLIDNSCRV